MDIPTLFLKTILLRPYVFIFLAMFLVSAWLLIGWTRTWAFFFISWITAFVCEFSSTRIGIPFGDYYYTGSTVGHELYLSNVPFMDSLSFTFLLYASYCVALLFLLPGAGGAPPALRLDRAVRTSVPALLLTALWYAFIDIVIDPVALRGDQWFLGRIYGYPTPGVYFGVPVANFVGWAVVGLIALSAYFVVDRRLADEPAARPLSVTQAVLLGSALYYAVLLFNLTVTFWIGERLLGMSGILIYLPVTALALLRLLGRLSPAA